MTALIVDDQTNVVSGIVSGIRWDKLGIRKVLTAYNAFEAKEILKSRHVDILLCDIEMPAEDGLSLLRWINDNGLEPVCIFLTAHADFMYAKEAIGLGGFDYILQPARYEDIEQSIARATDKIRQNRELAEFSSYSSLIRHKKSHLLDGVVKEWFFKGKADKAFADLAMLGVRLDKTELVHSAMIHVVRQTGSAKPMESELVRFSLENMLAELFDRYGQNIFCAAQDTDLYLLAVYCSSGGLIDREGVIRQLYLLADICRRELMFEIACYIGAPHNASELPERAGQLLSMSRDNVSLSGGVFDAERHTESIAAPLPDMTGWGGLLTRGGGGQVRLECESWLERLSNAGQLNANYLMRFYHSLMQTLYGAAQQLDMPAEDLFADGISDKACLSISGMNAFVVFAVERFNNFFSSRVNEKRVIDQIVDYIYKNIERDISREDIANIVFFSSTYISRLFKKEMGVSLKRYILEAKMKEARVLLQATELPVGVIAAKVGYENFSHFTQIYKKIYGLTPTEERAACLRR